MKMDDDEEMEEANAKPENQNQKDLVAYFNGEKEFSDRILKIFLEERDAENPNLPLIRKYFKKANPNLKSLILHGLDHYPGSVDLLSDLGYFHEFENLLSVLITYYTQACVDQENMETFSELAQDFYYATVPDGYEALYALRDLFEPGTDKRPDHRLFNSRGRGGLRKIPKFLTIGNHYRILIRILRNTQNGYDYQSHSASLLQRLKLNALASILQF